jgi:hypothetical protein
MRVLTLATGIRDGRLGTPRCWAASSRIKDVERVTPLLALMHGRR